VIDKELEALVPSKSSVEELNETFLKQNIQNYECSIEAAKLIYDLNPSANQKRALDLLNDTNNKLNSTNLKVKRLA
jgi:hypothetical protein